MPSGEAALAAEVVMLRRELAACKQECALAVKREAYLSAELQHRIHNMLAILRSISARTLDTSDEEDSAGHFRGRLDALARAELRRGKSP